VGGAVIPNAGGGVVVSPETQAAADKAVWELFSTATTLDALSDAVADLTANADSPEKMAALVGSLLSEELSDEQFSKVIDGVFSKPLSDENFGAALDVVFSEPLSDEQFGAVIDSIFDEPLSDDQFDDLVNFLDSDTISEEQVASAVDAIIDAGISPENAESLATSGAVLQSISGAQADEIFSEINLGTITDEDGQAIVDAVQDANKDVRESFEDNINVFAGQFDKYVSLNSKIDVGDRRTVVAVSVVSTAAVATMGAAQAMPVRGAAPISGGGGGGGATAELAEAFKQESNRIRRMRKYKYKDGVRVMDKKAFSKKLFLSIMQNSFTLVGFIIVYLTLSGSVRTIAGVATLAAFFATLYIDMREPEDD